MCQGKMGENNIKKKYTCQNERTKYRHMCNSSLQQKNTYESISLISSPTTFNTKQTSG